MSDQFIFYKTAIESLSDGVIFTNASGEITYVNQAMERLSGYPSEELLGQNDIDCLFNLSPFQQDCDETRSFAMQSHASSFESDRELYCLTTKGGKGIPIFWTIQQADASESCTKKCVHVFRDGRLFYDLCNHLREWEQRASMDFLTQLPNRSYIDMNLRSRLFEYRRNNWSFGVIMIDIDYFKKFNDEHGHDVGDLVLKNVASILAKHSRPYDVVGRWGGEEFIGIAANVDKLGLYSWAERLRFLIQKSALKHGNESLRVTISIGATIVRVGDDEESLIKRADENLYQSKENGRNRTTLDS